MTPKLDRVRRAMLFGDVKGFSKLTDAELPKFIEAVLKAYVALIERHPTVEFTNTWGDGLFMVFADPGDAARAALDLQEALEKLDIAFRIGGHLGPVFTNFDPILGRQSFYGAHVSRAARIEPVTPEGCVYVTETFAAAIEFAHGDEFACEYVGMIETPKGFGTLPIFLLRHQADGVRTPRI